MSFFFFFNDTATTEIYTLSLHDALPISNPEQIRIAKQLEEYGGVLVQGPPGTGKTHTIGNLIGHLDRKSTRLNSSHLVISYAVFCLKKKNSRVTLHVPDQESSPDRRVSP